MLTRLILFGIRWRCNFSLEGWVCSFPSVVSLQCQKWFPNLVLEAKALLNHTGCGKVAEVCVVFGSASNLVRADIGELPLADRLRFFCWERARRLGQKFVPDPQLWPENPSATEVTAAVAALEMELEEQLRLIVDSRPQNWRHLIHDSDINSSKGLFNFLKTNPSPRLQSMEVNGVPTFDINAILAEVTAAWEPIFDRTDAPDPNVFMAEYAPELTALRSPCVVEPINGQALMDQVLVRSPTVSGGLDYWRTVGASTFAFAFLDLYECGGTVWTMAWGYDYYCSHYAFQRWRYGVILKLRPISPAVVIRAAWASLRFKHLKPWRQAVCPASALGEPLQQILELALTQEEALHGVGSQATTMFFDKAKCFDKLVLPIISAVWTALGGPSTVLSGFAHWNAVSKLCGSWMELHGPHSRLCAECHNDSPSYGCLVPTQQYIGAAAYRVLWW